MEWFNSLGLSEGWQTTIFATGIGVVLVVIGWFFGFFKWLSEIARRKGKVAIDISLDENNATKRWVVFHVSKTGEKKITLTELQASQDGKKWITIVSSTASVGPNLSGYELPLRLEEGDLWKPKIPVETFNCIFSKQENLNSPCQITFRFKSLEGKFYCGNKTVSM